MIVEATPAQVRSILGAMSRVAAPLGPADRAALAAAYRYVFRGALPLDVDGLPPTAPEELARALTEPGPLRARRRHFGRAFWTHYRSNGYPFPGEPEGLNERFATPHDSTHVLSGYDTTPRGEVLVSTFTAAMHRREPMSGHILPVIFSWHLGIQLNAVAKHATGALDPEAFWLAWDPASVMRTSSAPRGTSGP